MRTPNRALGALLVLWLAPGLVAARPHLVDVDEIGARLSDAAHGRERDVQKLGALLATPMAEEAARARGAEVAALRAGLARLSDSDLRDLASRAEALQTDPAASGVLGTVLLSIVAMALIALLVVGLAVVVVGGCAACQ